MRTDYNSIKNQDIKSKFVSREVYGNVTSMASYILNKSFEDRNAPFSWDDVENLYKYRVDNIFTECEEEMSEDKFETYKEQIKERISDLEDFIYEYEASSDVDEDVLRTKRNALDKYNEHLSSLDDVEQEQAEIYEYWLVSGWLCEKLREKGECVISSENIWCRCTMGQAILLDHVISDICNDMNILEGQANDWSK